MLLDDLVLVSVDDHVVEPPDMFEGRLPSKFADLAPRVTRREDGTEVWRFCGMDATNIGLNAVVGRPVEEYGIEPTSFAEIRKGCYDIHERIRDMDANGVLGSMCFPSFPNLCGQLFSRAAEDRELGLAVLRAYNDWHIDEWCGTYPGRFIPLVARPIWDPEQMAEEVRRVAKKGAHAVSFSENPAKLKLPSFHSEHWDPVLVRVLRRGDDRVPSHRLVLVPGHDGCGCTDRRAPCAAAGQYHPGGCRPLVVARSPEVPGSEGLLVRRRDRMDPVLLGADGLDLRAPARMDGSGLRRPAPE